MTISSTILVAPVVSGPRALLARRGLAATVWTARAGIPTEMLLLELLGKTVGSFVESTGIGGLQVALLSLVLGLLVGVHEVPIAAVSTVTTVGLLLTPHLLLVNRLRKGRGSGGESTAVVLKLLTVTAAGAGATTEAKGKIEAVALLGLLLLLVVHGGWRRAGGGCRGGAEDWRPQGEEGLAAVVGRCGGEGCGRN